MYALSVMLTIAPERIEEFRAAALGHAANTRNNEQGCVSFTVFSAPDDPALFYFHECYDSKRSVEEVHNKAPYFAAFGELTKPWVVRKEIRAWESVE